MVNFKENNVIYVAQVIFVDMEKFYPDVMIVMVLAGAGIIQIGCYVRIVKFLFVLIKET